MFRFLQNTSFQRFFLDVVVRRMQQKSHTSIPNQIPVSPTSSSIEVSGKNFVNENVVITGGAQGLGKTLAIKLARLHANVAIWDDNNAALVETTQMIKVIGGRVHSYLCDMSQRDDIYKTAEKTQLDIGQVTMIINSADTASEKLLLDTPDHLIQRAFDINTLSMFWTTKAFLPKMIDANRGHIVTISSMAGHMGVQKLTDYCATKAAAGGFMAALKTELEREGSRGVKTTLVCPYFIDEGNSTVRLRFVKPLQVEDVANRTIQAITKSQDVVFMPGWFRYAVTPRWIMPSMLTSLFLRMLIKDFNPSMEQSAPTRIVQFIKLMEPIEPSPVKNEPVDDIQKFKESKGTRRPEL